MRTQISLPQPVPETVRSQRSPFVMGVKRFVSLNLLITQPPDGSAQVLTEDLRQFPRGEVAALISLVPVDEVAEGTLPPNSRWSVDLSGKHSDPDLLRQHFGAVRNPGRRHRNSRSCRRMRRLLAARPPLRGVQRTCAGVFGWWPG